MIDDLQMTHFEKIKKDIDQHLTRAINDLETLELETFPHSDDDLQFVVKVLQECKLRIYKNKLVGKVHLLRSPEAGPNKKYLAIILRYPNHHFVIDINKNDACVTFHKNFEGPGDIWTSTFSITKETLQKRLAYDSHFWREAKKITKPEIGKPDVPIGTYFVDLKRFLRIAFEIEFTDYPAFYAELMKKIDQPEEGT